MEQRAFIHIQNVSKSFKSIKAVDHLNLSVPKGCFLGLLGPNGAGKTTLVEMIEGIQKPDSGTITIDGKRWGRDDKILRQFIGICLQETQYMEKVTVDETIRLFASIFHTPSSKIAELYTQFGLANTKNQYILNLSGGQRQKVSLLLALLNQPQLLILDEPTTGLDPAFRREIWELLMFYKATGLTLLLTTHYMEEAEFLCDEIVLLNKGTIIKQGSLTELLTTLDNQESVIVEVLEKNRLSDLQSLVLPWNIAWNSHTGIGIFKTNDPANTLTRLFEILQLQKFTVLRLECKRNTLEDLFIQLTGDALLDD